MYNEEGELKRVRKGKKIKREKNENYKEIIKREKKELRKQKEKNRILEKYRQERQSENAKQLKNGNKIKK